MPGHIPALEELYRECGTDFDLSLDVKDPAATPTVLAVARVAGGDAVHRLWLCHHDWEQVAHSKAKMQLYSVNAITTGTDAQGEVTVRLEQDGRIVNGLGSDTDILVASAKAYINALNKLHSKQERLNPQLAANA